MTTPEQLHEFLSSIAPITGNDYQIRTHSGELLYTTDGDRSHHFPPDALDGITRDIASHNAFRYDVLANDMYLSGCPISNGGIRPTVLLAYGPRTNGYNQARHRELIRHHLDKTVALVEECVGCQVEIQELAHQLELSFEDLYLYSQISDQVKSLTLSKQMLNNIMMKIVDNMHVDAAYVTFPHRPQFDMEIYRPVPGLDPARWEDFLYALQELGRPQIDKSADNFIITNDSRSDPAYEQLAASPYRSLMVGVRHQGELFGWIGLTSFNLQEIFRQGELRMLKSLAEQLAIVIANTDLYKNLEQFTEGMVRSLVFAIEAKDPYTRGHSERVHYFTMKMAKALGLGNETYESLKWASILHDVGKIGIPEHILLKPGKLTDEEFALIKAHPEKGGHILQPVPQLANSLGGIVHHHERYDGNGYPHGLKGEQIPLAARIIAVADTFDAITSNRTYRKAKTPREALEILRSVAGSQLDPKMVKLFEEVYKRESTEQQHEYIEA